MSLDDKKLDSIFALRYAVRVLSRHARFWRNAAALLKFLGLLSGSLALGSVMANNAAAALWLGVLFAVAQCLEHVFSPAEKALASELQSRRYAQVWADRTQLSPERLEQAYNQLVAADGIATAVAFQQLAYDDVVREQGLSADSCYGGNRALRWLS